MIQGKSVLAVIPARGNSRELPRKNIRLLAGRPLLAWTITEAQKSKYIDRYILSSEDQEIIEVARSLGCEIPFIRPRVLAQDDTPGIEPVLHALTMLPGYDLVVMLQPTSPLRLVSDMDGCIEQCVRQNAPACVSVTEAEQNPYWMYQMTSDNRLQSLLEIKSNIFRRQDLPRVFILNGAVYVAKSDWLKGKRTFLTDETLGYMMPSERSVDVDTELDFQKARALLEQQKT